MADRFSVDFSNIRGLRTNFYATYVHTANNRPAVLALSETQIGENSDHSEFNLPGYNLVPLFFPHHGLAVYIRNDVAYQLQPQYGLCSNTNFNFMWLKFTVNKHIIHTCFLYRSPNLDRNSTFNEFDALSDSIQRIVAHYPHTEIVIAGDFNVHNSSWLRFSGQTTPEGRYVELFAELNHLTQLVDEPTRIPDVAGQSANTLDLFLTSDPDKYTISVLSPLGTSDHCVVSAIFSCQKNPVREKTPKRTVWHYEKANWDGLNDFFRSFNWSLCFLDSDVDASADMITNLILCGMRNFIPNRIKSIKPKENSWFDSSCKEVIRVREVSFRSYKANPTEENRKKFQQARKTCNGHIRRTKFLHDQKLRQKILQCPNSSKNFWSFAKNIRNATSSSVPTLVFNDTPFVSSLEKANLLAAQFAVNSTLPESVMTPPVLESTNDFMGRIFFRTRAVARVLKDLDIHKSAGPDSIPPIVLKRCSSTLAKPLRKLFHLSYSTGLFPSGWKTAFVQPVPKKGVSSSPSNYRPIALTSLLSKVMETLINFQLKKYLEERKLLNDRQYGFRSNRSTGDLMVYLTEQWNKSLHRFGESKIIALDISKAFDRVWHQALLSKMRAFGIDESLLRWIRNYLSDRSIQVVLDGFKSETHKINAGVPQGSVLSPTLFLIFINDLLSETSNPLNCFADDSTLSFSYSFLDSHPCPSDVELERQRMISSLNSDLDSIVQWGIKNRVEFNASKTQCCLLSLKRNTPPMPLSMSGTCIEETEKLSVLGMCITDHLLWNDHIFDVAKNAAKCLGFLRRCKKFFTPSDLAVIYKAFIRPKLEYNSHVWAGAPITHLSLLDRIQRRAVKMIGDRNITETFASLDHRRNVSCLSLFYRYFYKQCSSEIASCIPPLKEFNRNTRTSRNAHQFTLEPNFGRTVKYRDSFFSRTTRMWNALPGTIFPCHFDIQRFKTNVHRHLLLNPSLFS